MPTMSELRKTLWDSYVSVRKARGKQPMTQRMFARQMQRETREATAADGTIDGADLGAAFDRVCLMLVAPKEKP